MHIFKDLFIYLLCYLFIYYVYNILPPCMPTFQKRAPDLITDGCEPPCGCWELNPSTLEKQPVVLTAELSAQLQTFWQIYTAIES